LIYKIILLSALLLTGQIVIPSYAATGAGEIIIPGVSPFENDFADVKLLDSYFGTFGQKIEAEPGDKNVPLTIVLTNSGTQDITGIKGLLSLPIGFSGVSSSNGLIQADNTETATSGQSFALTFFVNIDKIVNINDYPGTIKITYSRVRENGERTAFLDFNFKVTGKGSLNIKAGNPFLVPSSNNDVEIEISNSGSAALNNVDITIQPQNASNTSGIVVSENHWNVGSVQPGSNNTFSFKAFIPQTLIGQTLHAVFSITYFNGQGDQITTIRSVDFIVGPANLTSNIVISSPPYLFSAVMQNLTLGIENRSPSKISNIGITIKPNSDSLKILQDNRWFIQEINPLEKTDLVIPIFADKSIEGTAVDYDVNILYTKEGSTVVEKQNFATYIRGVIDISVHDIRVAEIAGKKMVIGDVLNQGNVKAVFGQVTVTPIDNSIIKESSQYIGDIDIDAPVPFNIPINSNTPLIGDQKVQVTLTWKDTLLQQHTITEIDTVSFGTPNVSSSDNSNFNQLQIIILVAIAAGIGGIMFKVRKKKIVLEKKVQESS
jgi:hypothetical protein